MESERKKSKKKKKNTNKNSSASITLYSVASQDHIRSNYFLYTQNPHVEDYFSTGYRVFKKERLESPQGIKAFV